MAKVLQELTGWDKCDVRVDAVNFAARNILNEEVIDIKLQLRFGATYDNDPEIPL